MFGLKVPQKTIEANGSPIRYWGCRAIENNGVLDIVHDRISYKGPEFDTTLSQEEWSCLPFIWWINHVAMPRLNSTLSDIPYEKEVVIEQKEDESFTMIVRRSGGYVYVGAYEYHVNGFKYDLQERPEGEWSGTFDPEIGNRVEINFNGFGTGMIVSYFCECGYLGVRVKLDKQPDWHVKQGQPPYALVFGAEIKPIEKT
jgi:hypothetical protein